ncbi:NAD+ synthase [Prochlorothrix hollandica]|uniref:NAD+ synthase n=1 Tax=Prochlorothrix hollandica TaxID=1223 RepID=UPI00333F7BAB
MKITLAQLNPTVGDLVYNAQQIEAAAHRAAAQGADLLLTPELSLCGYPPRDLLLNPSFTQAIQHQLQTLAQALPPALGVLVGTVEPNLEADRHGEKPLFNSIALLKDGQVQQIFHKRLLPTYDVFDEDRYFEPGKDSHDLVFQLGPDSPKIGVTICEDFWNEESFWGKRHYPQNPIADLVAQGVDLIVNLSASPYILGKQVLRESMLGHSARLHQVPILYANQVGGNDDLIFDGRSVVLNRQGEVVSRAPGFIPALRSVWWDAQGRDVIAAVEPDMEPDGEPDGEPAIDPLAPSPEAELWEALVLGVGDYGRKCGFRKIVVGLSGGIDSALVATIAAAALGAPQVLAVLMPSPYSSDHSVGDALALVDNLGIQSHKIPIVPVMAGFDQGLADLFAGEEPDVTEENLQSRIRGTLLMAIANKFGHLLLSTGNKSEMAVGYCTLYGDMDGGLAAIADVPKTQVYRLCQWINGAGNGRVRQQLAALNPNFGERSASQPLIPVHILTKPPSAELKPDQVDQDSLPDYEILDAILDRMVHQHQSQEQIIAAGFEAAVVQKIWKLVVRSEFKRRQAPPGLKITDRAFGTGWRMPIASRW